MRAEATVASPFQRTGMACRASATFSHVLQFVFRLHHSVFQARVQMGHVVFCICLLLHLGRCRVECVPELVGDGPFSVGLCFFSSVLFCVFTICVESIRVDHNVFDLSKDRDEEVS